MKKSLWVFWCAVSLQSAYGETGNGYSADAPVQRDSVELVCTAPELADFPEIAAAHQGIKDTYEAWVELISSAQFQIDLDMAYLYDGEAPGKSRSKKISEFVGLVLAKAISGVKVRLFVDSNLSAFDDYRGIERFPSHPNIKVVWTQRAKVFVANHKKIIVIDRGESAYVGSANFDANVVERHVGDCGAVFRGSQAAYLGEVFESYFQNPTSSAPVLTGALPYQKLASSCRLGSTIQAKAPSTTQSKPNKTRVVCSHFRGIRAHEDNQTLSALIELIQSARESIDLLMYYIRFKDGASAGSASVLLSQALNEGCKRGVRVRIAVDIDAFVERDEPDVQKNQDRLFAHLQKRIPDCLGSPRFEFKLVKLGSKQDAYYPPQMHNKSMVVDGQTAWVGSENWPDFKYFDTSSNCGAVFSEPSEVQKLERVFLAYWECRCASPVTFRQSRRIFK